MITVVAAQELRAGDFLLRFKAEASQDDIHGSAVGLLDHRRCLEIVAIHRILFTFMSYAFF